MNINWKEIVRNIAPIIGSTIGGPFGGAAMAALSNTILGKPDGTEKEIEIALQQATPEQLVALKQADNDFKIKMADLGVKEDELFYKDVASARKLFTVNIWPQIILSAFYTIGYFIVLILLMTKAIDLSVEMQPTFNIILGVLTAAIPMILQFWFGSSNGSKEKTAGLINGKH